MALQWSKVRLAADVEHEENPAEDGWLNSLYFGFEYIIKPGIALRAGLKDKSPTVGFGVNGRTSVDYAYDTHTLGGSHRISVGYTF
jgi:hypothetical protein